MPPEADLAILGSVERAIVGRSAELAVIEAHLDRLAGPEGSVVLLAGEPGIGKTRLAEEVVARAATRGAMTAWGRCWEAGGAPPYWPWTEALRAVVTSGNETASRSSLAVGSNDIGQILGDAGATPSSRGEDEGARFRLYEGCMRLFEDATRVSPVAIILDDVHVADPSSLLLLQFIAARIRPLPVLIVATYRDSELTVGHVFTEALGQLLREPTTTRLSLSGLETSAVAQLMTATTAVAAPGEVVRRVRDQTDGNPLYVAEIARLLASEGRLGQFDDIALPRDVRETVLQRVARLPPATWDALTTAAVLGREFAIDLLLALSSPGVLDHLDPAAAADLIAAGGRLGRLRFSHAVVAQALYDEVPPSRRLQLHAAAANALVALHEHDLDSVLTELAHHYCSAVPVAAPATAVDFARRAAARAVQMLAFEEGTRLYRMALAVLESTGSRDDPPRADLLLAMGDAQARSGDSAESKETFERAATIARASGDGVRLAQAALGYGGRIVWIRAGRDKRVVALLDEALAALPEEDSIIRARVAARLAGALRDDWSRTERDAISAQALAMARRLGDPTTLASALAARYTAIWGPDTVDEMSSLADEAESLTVGGDAEREIEARWLQFVVFMMAGDIDSCRIQQQENKRLAEELRQPSQRWYSSVMRDVQALMIGPLHHVEEMLEETRATGATAQAADAEASYRLALLQLRGEQGRHAEVESEALDGLRDFPGYRLFQAWHALIQAQNGELAAASATATELLDGGDRTLPFDNGWLFSMALLAEVAVDLGDMTMGERIYALLEPYGHLMASATGEVVRGSTSLSLGMLAALLGRFDTAEHHLDTALRVHRRMGARVLECHTIYQQTLLLERRNRRGDSGRASALRARILADARELGMVTLERRVKLGVPGSGSSRPGGLTPREQVVASAVARGLSNRQIADELFVSERTVESHVQNILMKLGFSSRAAVATWVAANDRDAPGT